MITAVICTTLLALQTPTATDSTTLQNFDGLLLDAPETLKLVEDKPEFKSWQAQIRSTKDGKSGVTQAISVVVADLSKIPNKVTPDQFCDLHDRASRTRKGFASQLFKTEKTEINGSPMVVLVGSMQGRDIAQKPISTYHVSAAFATKDKAYEVTWITYYAGAEFTNAIKAVRNINLKAEETVHKPKRLVGTPGAYKILGTPFQYVMPAPATITTDTKVGSGMSARFIGTVTQEKWYATVELAQFNEPQTTNDPIKLLSALGYEAWTKLEPTPKATLTNGIHVFENIPISENRHARIDIAVSGKYILATIVSTPKEEALPPRSTIALIP